MDTTDLAQRIARGARRALARGITLVERARPGRPAQGAEALGPISRCRERK